MALSTTLATLYERVAKNVWENQFPVKITATGGAVGTFIASTGGYSSSDANAYDGVWIYILNDAGGAAAAPEAESARVTAAGFTAATGTWAINPNWTAAVASGDTGLFLYGLHIVQILDAINDVQREVHVSRYLPPTLVTDGDFEATGVANWTNAVGTPTKTKDTTTVLTGIQSLKIVTTTLGHAVTSANIAVTPGEHLLLSTPILNTAGSITVQLYDVTNSVVIDSVTIAETTWTEARFESVAPSSCRNVAIRYASATASTTAYVGWCVLLSRDRNIYSLPSSITDASHVEGAYLSDLGYSGGANSYLSLTSFQDWSASREWRDWRAINAQRIELNIPSFYPVFLKFRSVATTLAAHTDTTPIPEDVVVAGAVAGCFRRLGDMAKWERWHAAYTSLLDRYDLLKPTVVSAGQRRVRAR